MGPQAGTPLPTAPAHAESGRPVFRNSPGKRAVLAGMGSEAIADLLESIGERRSRAPAVFSGIHRHGCLQLDELPAAVDVSPRTAARLAEVAVAVDVSIDQSRPSPDGSIKYLVRLADGRRVESVFLPQKDRRTLCVSSQVGCVLDCTFCATGAMGFERNLTSAEIVGQLLLVRAQLAEQSLTNVVFMGMGEPFYNYDHVLRAAELLCEPRGIALALRRVSISTAGVLPSLERFFEEGRRFMLAISITSAIAEKRSALMPVNQRFPLDRIRELLRSLPRYYDRRIMLEVPLLRDRNDGIEDAVALREFCRDLPYRINLIPWNPVATFPDLARPADHRLLAFQSVLREAGLPVFIRKSLGCEVQGACGQLALTAAG